MNHDILLTNNQGFHSIPGNKIHKPVENFVIDFKSIENYNKLESKIVHTKHKSKGNNGFV